MNSYVRGRAGSEAAGVSMGKGREVRVDIAGETTGEGGFLVVSWGGVNSLRIGLSRGSGEPA